jgi:hypothetical protein
MMRETNAVRNFLTFHDRCVKLPYLYLHFPRSVIDSGLLFSRCFLHSRTMKKPSQMPRKSPKSTESHKQQNLDQSSHEDLTEEQRAEQKALEYRLRKAANQRRYYEK